MRRPTAVVGVATAAVLLAGVAAAYAGETPQVPALPGPGGPVLPALPADPAPQDPAPAGQRGPAGRPHGNPDLSLDPGARVQQRVLVLVNAERRAAGCAGLTLDRRLIAAAARHAADMADRGYFAHESPAGDGAADRVSDAGYRWSAYGENIARGQDGPDEVVDGWMNSPEHRANILDCGLHQVGVGMSFGDGHTPYWVQDFATPR